MTTRAVSFAATLTTGLMAGVFGAYAVAVMPGLRETDDRTFVGAFQAIDRAIVNPLFMLVFVGALVLNAASAVLQLRRDGRSALVWSAAATGLYLVAFVVTVVVHVPLNDQLKEAGDPDGITDLAAVRERFDEARWMTWNIVRTAAAIVAFALQAWAPCAGPSTPEARTG